MGEAPNFFLYGEAPRPAETGFLHLEPLAVRSRPSDWTISLHRHLDLSHIFLMVGGGGSILGEGKATPFRAPCLLLIPAGVAHGFAFWRESAAHVLTMAAPLLASAAARAEAVAGLFRTPRVLGCPHQVEALQSDFADLARELAWRAPGHDLAVEGLVCRILVAALRLEHQADGAVSRAVSRDQALLARFRERLEQTLRDRCPLEDYAQTLGVSLSRLHKACRSAAGATPLAIVQARLLLEAKRSLLYSDMSIADLSFDLGFCDPAYFSRFFSKHAGLSPSEFRRQEQGGAP